MFSGVPTKSCFTPKDSVFAGKALQAIGSAARFVAWLLKWFLWACVCFALVLIVIGHWNDNRSTWASDLTSSAPVLLVPGVVTIATPFCIRRRACRLACSPRVRTRVGVAGWAAPSLRLS